MSPSPMSGRTPFDVVAERGSRTRERERERDQERDKEREVERERERAREEERQRQRDRDRDRELQARARFLAYVAGLRLPYGPNPIHVLCTAWPCAGLAL